LKNILTHQFNQLAVLEVYHELELSEEKSKRLNSQIIIRTFPINPIEGKSLIHISYMLTGKDIKNVYGIIHSLKQDERYKSFFISKLISAIYHLLFFML